MVYQSILNTSFDLPILLRFYGTLDSPSYGYVYDSYSNIPTNAKGDYIYYELTMTKQQVNNYYLINAKLQYMFPVDNVGVDMVLWTKLSSNYDTYVSRQGYGYTVSSDERNVVGSEENFSISYLADNDCSFVLDISIGTSYYWQAQSDYYQDLYTNAYESGYTDGRLVGYNEGVNSGNDFTGVFGLLGQAFGSAKTLMDAQFIGGLSIGAFVTIPIAITIVIAIFKMLRK